MEVVKERKEEKQENLENVEQTISLKEKIKKVVLDILQNNLICCISGNCMGNSISNNFANWKRRSSFLF